MVVVDYAYSILRCLEGELVCCHALKAWEVTYGSASEVITILLPVMLNYLWVVIYVK